MGPDLTANVDLTPVDRSMADVERRSKAMAPAFRDLRKPLRADQRTHARTQEGPLGAWPPRSPLTEARRKAKNRRARTSKAMRTIGLGGKRPRSTPKRILGRLPGAIIVTVGDLYVRAVSRVDWSGVHQYGGTAGHRARIPARTFLWLSGYLIRHATDVLTDYVWKGWGE